MPNKYRGEIEAEIGGAKRKLVLTLGALAELEAAFGAEDLIALTERFGSGRLKARDLTQALEIANGTQYALTGGLYTRSPQNIARVRREFRVGNLYINRKITGALVERQPFGGFKLSGIGGSKAGGSDYLGEFLLTRAVTENTLRRGFAPEDATEPAEEVAAATE